MTQSRLPVNCATGLPAVLVSSHLMSGLQDTAHHLAVAAAPACNNHPPNHFFNTP
jgi:hypothetical protein